MQTRVAASLSIFCCVFVLGCEPKPGKLADTWETSNSAFRIRVDTYEEGNSAHLFEPGTHYKLQSAPVGSNTWTNITQAYYAHGSQPPKLSDHVRFVNDKTAFVFLQGWYAVTTDGGVSWSLWQVAAHLPEKVFDNLDLIREVRIAEDGRGVMSLNPKRVRNGEALELTTNDYGQRWDLK